MKTKILFFKINECGRLEQCKQEARSIVITFQNLDEIMKIIKGSGMELYNGTNRIYSDPKKIRTYIEKKLNTNGRKRKIK